MFFAALLGAVIGGVIGAAVSVAVQLSQGRSLHDLDWRAVGAASLQGAITGGVTGLTLGLANPLVTGVGARIAVGAAGSMVGGLLGLGASSAVTGEMPTGTQVLATVVASGLGGGFGGVVAGPAASTLVSTAPRAIAVSAAVAGASGAAGQTVEEAANGWQPGAGRRILTATGVSALAGTGGAGIGLAANRFAPVPIAPAKAPVPTSPHESLAGALGEDAPPPLASAPPATTTNVPDLSNVPRGAQLGSGKYKQVFPIEGDPDHVLAVLEPAPETRASVPPEKLARALDDERGMLQQLEDLGAPTAKIETIGTVDGKPAFIQQRYAMGTRDDSWDTQRWNLLNQNTIDDAARIKAALQKGNIDIDDAQFMVGKDGHLVVADPRSLVARDPRYSHAESILDDIIEESNDAIARRAAAGVTAPLPDNPSLGIAPALDQMIADAHPTGQVGQGAPAVGAGAAAAERATPSQLLERLGEEPAPTGTGAALPRPMLPIDQAESKILQRFSSYLPAELRTGGLAAQRSQVLDGPAFREWYLANHHDPVYAAKVVDKVAAAYDTRNNRIVFNRDRAGYNTSYHETLHMYSSKAFVNGTSKGFNEAVTEYLTQLDEPTLVGEGEAYPNAVQVMRLLSQKLGKPFEDALRQAYFGGDLDALRNAVGGPAVFDRLNKLLDDQIRAMDGTR